MDGYGNRLTFDEQYHAYWWDGAIYVPSVTQIIDANGYTSDFCKSQSHADRGTDIHKMVQIEVGRRIFNKTVKQLKRESRVELDELTSKYPAEFDQFNQFCADYDLEFVGSEKKIHGSLQLYEDNGLEYRPDWAGTNDITAVKRKTDQYYLIDVKTGMQPPRGTYLQTAAYTISEFPIGYEDIKRMALKLHAKRKSYGTKPYDDRKDFSEWETEVRRYYKNNPR